MKKFSASGIFWVDGSVRFRTSDLSSYQRIALRSDGVTAFTGTDHSVFSVTPPEMFDFLPMKVDPKKAECLMATLVLLYRTKNVIDNIIYWWVNCALSPKCIYSETNRACFFNNNKWSRYAKCSRFDQSALSILLYNRFSNIMQIRGQSNKFRIQRGGSGGMIKTC